MADQRRRIAATDPERHLLAGPDDDGMLHVVARRGDGRQRARRAVGVRLDREAVRQLREACDDYLEAARG